jgi:hypothetical protein
MLPSCIVAVAPVHDESAVVKKDLSDHVANFSFANWYDRDSSGSDKPGGIRMHLKMREVGPMNLQLGQASVSRDGGPWQACEFGQRAYNAGGSRPYDYSSIREPLWDPNYFNVLILCPAETVPANRSNGYAGIDPLKKGTYKVRVSYTLNGRSHNQEIELKLGRELKAGAGTILDAVAPWSSMDG